MGESELFEGNRFVRGIKKIHDGLLAIVRLYDQLRPAHVTLARAVECLVDMGSGTNAT